MCASNKHSFSLTSPLSDTMTESSIPNTNTAPSQASKTLCYSLIHILLTLLATVRKPGSKTVPGKTLLGQRKTIIKPASKSIAKSQRPTKPAVFNSTRDFSKKDIWGKKYKPRKTVLHSTRRRRSTF